MAMSTQPQSSWSPRMDKVNPCDTTQLLPHQPIRESCTSCSRILWLPSLTWLLRVLYGSSSAVWDFSGMSPLSLRGPAINLSWLQTPRPQLLCIGHKDVPLTSRWRAKLLSMVCSVRPPPPSLTPAVSTACLLPHTPTEVNFLELHARSWICAFAHVTFLEMVSTCFFSLTFNSSFEGQLWYRFFFPNEHCFWGTSSVFPL